MKAHEKEEKSVLSDQGKMLCVTGFCGFLVGSVVVATMLSSNSPRAVDGQSDVNGQLEFMEMTDVWMLFLLTGVITTLHLLTKYEYRITALLMFYAVCMLLVVRIRISSLQPIKHEVHPHINLLGSEVELMRHQENLDSRLRGIVDSRQPAADSESAQTSTVVVQEASIADEATRSYHEVALAETAEMDPTMAKLDAALQCFSHCDAGVESSIGKHNVSALLETDRETLLQHYDALVKKTEVFRPNHRRKSSVYKDYVGPRLEDHFIQHLASEDYLDTFFPLVPLFIHWTEVKFSAAGGGIKKLRLFLRKNLRKDVIYFTVTSCYSEKTQDILEKEGYRIIFASSKGDPKAHIILPHLFYYNPPGFNLDGEPVFSDPAYRGIQSDYFYDMDELSKSLGEDQLKHLPASRLKELRRNAGPGKRPDTVDAIAPIWKFRKYHSYDKMPNLTMTDSDKEVFHELMTDVSPGSVPGDPTTTESPDLFPKEYKVSFIGSTQTHHGRRELIRYLTTEYAADDNDGTQATEDFLFRFFPVEKKCVDYSAGSDVSYCWRVFMLSSKYALCPVGTAATSYRLYEALQMGVVPVYIYDERGPFVSYKGSEADISNLGLVFSFDEAQQKIDQIMQEDAATTDRVVQDFRKKIASVRQSHYTPAGVADQLKKWITSPHDSNASDLRCCANPSPVVI